MATHRRVSRTSLKARTVVGGVVVSGALMVGAPAGMALAKPTVTANNSLQAPPSKETLAKLKVLAAVQKSKIGQAVFKELAEPGHEKALAAVQAAIGKWIAKG